MSYMHATVLTKQKSPIYMNTTNEHIQIYIYVCVCTYAYMHIYIIYYSMRYIIYILHMQPTINHHPISLSPCRPSPALGISEVLDAAVEELTKAVPRATATNMGIYNG